MIGSKASVNEQSTFLHKPLICWSCISPSLLAKEENEETDEEEEDKVDDSLVEARLRILAIECERQPLDCCNPSAAEAVLLYVNRRLMELREGTFPILQTFSCTKRSRISHE